MTEDVALQRKDVDGGWAWILLLGCLYVSMTVSTVQLIFGIQIGPLTKQLQLSDLQIAFGFNAFNVCFNLTWLPAGVFVQQFGFRKVAMISSFAASAGYCLISVSNSAWSLILVFGFIVGPAIGVTHYAATTILPFYFEKKRGFALATFYTGVGMGSIMMPLLVRYLIDQYGNLGSILIYGGLLLNGCVVSALYRPVPRAAPKSGCSSTIHELKELKPETEEVLIEKEKHESLLHAIGKRFKDCLKMLTLFRVLINAISIACFAVGYVNFMMLVPYLMVDEGFSYQSAAYVMSTSAILSTVSRALMTVLADKKWFSVKIAYIVCSAVAGTFSTIFPLYANYSWYISCIIFFGIGLGVTMSLWMNLLIRTVGIDRYVSSASACGLVIAVAFCILGPTFGYIKVAGGSYTASIIACGVMQLVPPILWAFMPLATRLDVERESISARDPSAEM